MSSPDLPVPSPERASRIFGGGSFIPPPPHLMRRGGQTTPRVRPLGSDPGSAERRTGSALDISTELAAVMDQQRNIALLQNILDSLKSATPEDLTPEVIASLSSVISNSLSDIASNASQIADTAYTDAIADHPPPSRQQFVQANFNSPHPTNRGAREGPPFGSPPNEHLSYSLVQAVAAAGSPLPPRPSRAPAFASNGSPQAHARASARPVPPIVQGVGMVAPGVPNTNAIINVPRAAIGAARPVPNFQPSLEPTSPQATGRRPVHTAVAVGAAVPRTNTNQPSAAAPGFGAPLAERAVVLPLSRTDAPIPSSITDARNWAISVLANPDEGGGGAPEHHPTVTTPVLNRQHPESPATQAERARPPRRAPHSPDPLPPRRSPSPAPVHPAGPLRRSPSPGRDIPVVPRLALPAQSAHLRSVGPRAIAPSAASAASASPRYGADGNSSGLRSHHVDHIDIGTSTLEDLMDQGSFVAPIPMSTVPVPPRRIEASVTPERFAAVSPSPQTSRLETSRLETMAAVAPPAGDTVAADPDSNMLHQALADMIKTVQGVRTPQVLQELAASPSRHNCMRQQSTSVNGSSLHAHPSIALPAVLLTSPQSPTNSSISSIPANAASHFQELGGTLPNRSEDPSYQELGGTLPNRSEDPSYKACLNDHTVACCQHCCTCSCECCVRRTSPHQKTSHQRRTSLRAPQSGRIHQDSDVRDMRRMERGLYIHLSPSNRHGSADVRRGAAASFSASAGQVANAEKPHAWSDVVVSLPPTSSGAVVVPSDASHDMYTVDTYDPDSSSHSLVDDSLSVTSSVLRMIHDYATNNSAALRRASSKHPHRDGDASDVFNSRNLEGSSLWSAISNLPSPRTSVVAMPPSVRPQRSDAIGGMPSRDQRLAIPPSPEDTLLSSNMATDILRSQLLSSGIVSGSRTSGAIAPPSLVNTPRDKLVPASPSARLHRTRDLSTELRLAQSSLLRCRQMRASRLAAVEKLYDVSQAALKQTVSFVSDLSKLSRDS